ncbi:MAG: class I SAM-dependent methyltransferase [Nocardioidaceae bacterium]
MIVVSAPGSPRPVTPTTILASVLEDLTTRLDNVYGLDPAVRADLRTARALASGLDDYLSRWTTPESPALSRLAERTTAEDWDRRAGGGSLEQEMLSGHVEGQTLKMLVHVTRARRVLEIGMFTGYSALAMAEALPTDGVVVACEIDEEVAGFARRCFRESEAGHRIEVRVGPALSTLADLSASDEEFDLVFIDADKAAYVDYLDAVLDSGLLSPHGLVCVDNTLMQGQPWGAGETTDNGRAIAAFNEAVAADPRVEQVIVPLRDGLTLIRRSEGAPRAP